MHKVVPGTFCCDLMSYATLSNMSGYWGTSAGIESFDAELGTRQVDTLVLLLEELMVSDHDFR